MKSCPFPKGEESSYSVHIIKRVPISLILGKLLKGKKLRLIHLPIFHSTQHGVCVSKPHPMGQIQPDSLFIHTVLLEHSNRHSLTHRGCLVLHHSCRAKGVAWETAPLRRGDYLLSDPLWAVLASSWASTHVMKWTENAARCLSMRFRLVSRWPESWLYLCLIAWSKI